MGKTTLADFGFDSASPEARFGLSSTPRPQPKRPPVLESGLASDEMRRGVQYGLKAPGTARLVESEPPQGDVSLGSFQDAQPKGLNMERDETDSILDSMIQRSRDLLDQTFAGYDETRAANRVTAAAGLLDEPRAPMASERFGGGATRADDPVDPEVRDEIRAEKAGDLLAEAEELQKRAGSVESSPSAREFMQAESFGDAWQAFKQDPVGIVLEVGARSAAPSAQGLAAGAVGGLAAGPAGFATGMGAGSAQIEYAHGITEGLRKAGVDVTDPDALRKAVRDDALMDEVKTDAARGAAIVGGFDAVAGAIAPLKLAPKNAGVITRELTNLGAQMTTQAGLGAAGEAGKQIANEGRITEPGQVAAEAAGEFIGAPTEVAGAGLTARTEARTESGLRKAFTGEDMTDAEAKSLARSGLVEQVDGEIRLSDAGNERARRLFTQETPEADNALRKMRDRQDLSEQETTALKQAGYAKDNTGNMPQDIELTPEGAARFRGMADDEQPGAAQPPNSARQGTTETETSDDQEASQGLGTRPGPQRQDAVRGPEAEAAQQREPGRRAERRAGNERTPDPAEQSLDSPVESDIETPSTEGVFDPASALQDSLDRTAPVDLAAREAAESPDNDRPTPTDAQRKAGNYKKGSVRIAGLDVAIENPNGSTRTGTDRNGQKWRRKMVGHYGYVKRTEGNDGDAVDVYIKPGTQDADTAYVIDQFDEDGQFDEHKTVLGADSIDDARATYRANYPDGWKGDKTVTAMPIDQFKDWLKNGDLTQPAAPQRKVPPKSLRKADRDARQTQQSSAQPAWQQPRSAFYANPDNAGVDHEQAVQDAVARGETVPPEVLVDYPDLIAESKPDQETSATSTSAADVSIPDTAIETPTIAETTSPEPRAPKTVTRGMRADLSDLGYERADIDRMQPGMAAEIIAEQRRKPGVAISRAEKQRARVQKMRQIDNQNDDIITAVRKLGGINTDLESDWRGRLSHLNRKDRRPGLPGIEQTGDAGLTLDEMAERLAEEGYIGSPTDAYDQGELAELLSRAEQGEPVYGNAPAANALEQQAREQAEMEADRESAVVDELPDTVQQETGQPTPPVPEDGLEPIGSGVAFDESAYRPEWEQETRALAEWFEQAAQYDPDAAEDILSTGANDATVARRLIEVVNNGRREESARERRQGTGQGDPRSNGEPPAATAAQAPDATLDEPGQAPGSSFADTGVTDRTQALDAADRPENFGLASPTRTEEQADAELEARTRADQNDMFGGQTQAAQEGSDRARQQRSENAPGMGRGLFGSRSRRPQTETEAFKRWFGNSKVVNANGEPLVVYHGTNADFTAFDDNTRGKATRATSSIAGHFFASTPRTAKAYADHAATSAPVAELIDRANEASARGDEAEYDRLIEQADQLENEIERTRDGRMRGQNIMPAYISIQNPLEIDAQGETPEGIGGIDPLIQRAKREGRDGVIIRNFDDAAGLADEIADHYIAFKPEQIKSATGNRGTFDPNDPDILAARAYHGTPHQFDRFSLDAIGTGEGAQAFGWGLYFASKRSIAEHYRQAITGDESFLINGERVQRRDMDDAEKFALADVQRHGYDVAAAAKEHDQASWFAPTEKDRRFNSDVGFVLQEWASVAPYTGNLYSVDVPEPNELLDWDAPLRDQPRNVKDAITTFAEQNSSDLMASTLYAGVNNITEDLATMTGAEAYQRVSRERGYNAREASRYFESMGIPGLRYRDNTSRDGSGESRNYVIWDENAVTVEAVNDELRQAEVMASRGSQSDPAPAVSSTPTDQESADVDTLRQVLEEYFGRDDIDIAVATGVSSDSASAARELAPLFGKRVVFYQTADPQVSGFNGLALPSYPDVVYLNADAEVAHTALLGHELTHYLKRDRPDLWQHLESVATEQLQNVDEYRRWLDKLTAGEDFTASDELLREEIIADFIGDQFLKPSFWTQVMDQAEPGVAQRLAATLRRWLDNVLQWLNQRGFGSSRYVADIQRVRDAAAEAFAGYARTGDRPAGEQGRYAASRERDVSASRSETAGRVRRRFGRKPPQAQTDPFFEENRRIRDQDKTLWDRAGKIIRRQLSPRGLLPANVFDAKIARDSQFEVVEFDVHHLVGSLEAAVQKDYKKSWSKLPVADQRVLNEALAGQVSESIPKATRTALVAMRRYIDHLSTEYIATLNDQVDRMLAGPAAEAGTTPDVLREAMKDADDPVGAAQKALFDAYVESGESPDTASAKAYADTGAMADALGKASTIQTITGNIGRYVHRSYRAFDDAKWNEKLDDATIQAARDLITSRYRDQGETPAESARLAEVVLNEILKNGTAYDNLESFIAEGKLGAKDLSVLKQRQQIAPEIRALLGEYQDPRINFAKSATKMGRLIWNDRFLQTVREQGMGVFLFEGTDRPSDATVQIAAEGSESYAPLNGLWTYPEIAQAFSDALGRENLDGWYKSLIQLNGMVKFGKTVLSPTTAARNWQSAMFFALANGHFNLGHMAKSLSGLREYFTQQGKGSKLAYLRKLKELGVVYDTPYAGEMMRLLDDASTENDLLNNTRGMGLKKALDYAQKFYAYGDDFWKIIGFENERRSLMNAGLTEAEAETQAAERIRNTYPTYSMVPRAINSLRRFPLAGTFVSFPAEILRTTGNMLYYVNKDLRDPKLRGLGLKRVAGMAVVGGMFAGLQALSKAWFDIDDDEEEAVRDLAAPWNENSNLLFIGRDDQGSLEYFDLSFLDPYNMFKRPVTAMLRDEPWQEQAVTAAKELVLPFFGADITAETIGEVVWNKKAGTGTPVYNENASIPKQIAQIANHLRKSLQPGLFSNLERTGKALQGKYSPSGRKYKPQDEALAWVGWRKSTLDPKVGLYYRSFEFNDALSDAQKGFYGALRSPNEISEEDMRQEYATTLRMRRDAFEDMGEIVSAARKSGMSDNQIADVLSASSVSKDNINALLDGDVPPWYVTDSAIRYGTRKADAVFDQETADMIAERYNKAYQLTPESVGE